jgi:hypothetical protein
MDNPRRTKHQGLFQRPTDRFRRRFPAFAFGLASAGRAF